MKTKDLIENEHEFDYEVVEIDDDALAKCEQLFKDYGVNPQNYKFDFDTLAPWSKDHKPERVIRGLWYAARGKKGLTLSVQRDKNDKWEYRLELQTPYGDAWTTQFVVTGTDLPKMLTTITDEYGYTPHSVADRPPIWPE